MSHSVRLQFAEMYQACYSKTLPEFVELFDPDLGRKNAERYADLSARLGMLNEHKRIEKQRRKEARGHKS